MDLLLSSSEVYKKECLGFLLGYSLEDRFIVEHGFSYQAATRTHKGVLYHKKDHRKIKPIISKLDRIRIIGDFHSHTEYGALRALPVPSKEDIREMKAGNIYIIIAINGARRTRRWGMNKDGMLSGSVGDLYYKISACFIRKEKPAKVQRARLYCPFPPGF